MYPQVLLNVEVPRGFDWKKHQAIADAQSRGRALAQRPGRVLLRPSGTEPVLRVMVEGEPREAIESAANSIADRSARQHAPSVQHVPRPPPP